MPSKTDRRHFLRTAAAGAALTLSAEAYAKIPGRQDNLRIAFLGCGGRAQAHLNLLPKLLGLTAVGVCDVWDGLDEQYTQSFGGTSVTRRYSQGLHPAAAKCGFDIDDATRVTKDYRRLLDRKDVDIVCISTPDHWHARMTLDALAAGKDVFVETPMTRTAAEAAAVVEMANRTGRVVVVGAQCLADPAWKSANEVIRAGVLGPVSHVHGGAFRNDARGQWRFYRVVPQMTAATIDWPMFLGRGFDLGVADRPFDATAFAQWRCDSAFSSGPISDLLAPLAAKLLAATGLRQTMRVMAAGGLFHERDGRSVPDVATVVADFSEGCQILLTATTLSNYPLEEVIRGRRGSLKFVAGGVQMFRDEPANASRFPPRMDETIPPTEILPSEAPKNETEALWTHFLGCVRRRDRQTLCPPELGAAAVTITALGAESLTSGIALTWDTTRRTVRPSGMARLT